MFCENCGQNVPENSVSCPNCGAALTGNNFQDPNQNAGAYSYGNNPNMNVNPYENNMNNVNYNAPQQPTQQKTNGLCVAGFVVALVGLLCCGGVVGIVGLILSGVGLSQVGKTGQGGKGLGIAGVVLGHGNQFFVIMHNKKLAFY